LKTRTTNWRRRRTRTCRTRSIWVSTKNEIAERIRMGFNEEWMKKRRGFSKGFIRCKRNQQEKKKLRQRDLICNYLGIWNCSRDLELS
jgi:hypothetical protein